MFEDLAKWGVGLIILLIIGLWLYSRSKHITLSAAVKGLGQKLDIHASATSNLATAASQTAQAALTAAEAAKSAAKAITPPAATVTAPPATTAPAPTVIEPVSTPPFTIDPNTGFIAVSSIPGITQKDIVGDGWLCSVLALPYLDPKSANYTRVVQNCARDALAEAESKALSTTIFANTAYDVVQQADGSYKTDPNKSMPKNFVVPTEVNTEAATVAYCNAYPVMGQLAPEIGNPASAGHALALMAARRAAKAAKA